MQEIKELKISKMFLLLRFLKLPLKNRFSWQCKQGWTQGSAPSLNFVSLPREKSNQQINYRDTNWLTPLIYWIYALWSIYIYIFQTFHECIDTAYGHNVDSLNESSDSVFWSTMK